MFIGRSFLFHVVQKLDLTHVKLCVGDPNSNPWIKNSLDGKLVLHAALERGNIEICQTVLEKLKSRNSIQDPKGLSLMNMSFSLLQKALCNNIPIQKRNEKVNHVDCLQNLLEEDTEITTVLGNSNYSCVSSVIDLTKDLHDCEGRRLIEQKIQICFGFKTSGI